MCPGRVIGQLEHCKMIIGHKYRCGTISTPRRRRSDLRLQCQSRTTAWRSTRTTRHWAISRLWEKEDADSGKARSVRGTGATQHHAPLPAADCTLARWVRMTDSPAGGKEDGRFGLRILVAYDPQDEEKARAMGVQTCGSGDYFAGERFYLRARAVKRGNQTSDRSGKLQKMKQTVFVVNTARAA